MTHRIFISPSFDSNKTPRHNSRGPLFEVTHNGVIVVTASTEPCLDGARALKVLGYSGKLELWDDITPYVRLTADIDKAAKVTVREGERPPALAKFESFSQRSAKDVVFTAGGTEVAQNRNGPVAQRVAGGQP
jgi:hypothetical protein